MKFRKKQIKKYNWTIDYIREEMDDGKNFWAVLGSAGLTFQDDIRRFYDYALQVEALDISELIEKYYPEWI